jgi:ribosomal protein S26
MKTRIKRGIPKAGPGTKTKWDFETWIGRCAWCAKKVPKDQEVFGIGIRLRPEAFREFDPGTVQPLLLVGAGKTVPMMVVTEDSPAKKDGKDAMFQVCCEKCGKALQAALKAELGE